MGITSRMPLGPLPIGIASPKVKLTEQRWFSDGGLGDFMPCTADEAVDENKRPARSVKLFMMPEMRSLVLV